MKKTIIEIIKKINKQKKAANLHPDFVTLKEIRKELNLQLEIELNLLVEDEILKQGNNINDIYFIIKK